MTARPSQLWVSALLLLAVLTHGKMAAAHLGHRAYCRAFSVASGVDVELSVPHALVAGQAQPLEEAEAHVRAVTPNGECAIDGAESGRSGDGSKATFLLRFVCPDGPITLGIDYGIDSEPSAEVACSIDGRPHVFRAASLDYRLGTPPSMATQLLRFVALGSTHVIAGFDHVLFVLSLLLGSAAREPRRALRQLVGVVTGFTLGHSLTLTLAALGIARVDPALAESAIALSIVLVALQNVAAEDPRGRAVISATFGLVHGFGFASALAETGLPRRGAVVSLFAFNLGVELLQLTIVGACFPLLVWARKKAWFRRRLLVPASLAIATLGGVWFVQRAFGAAG